MKRHLMILKKLCNTFNISVNLLATLIFFIPYNIIAQGTTVSGTVTGDNNTPLNSVSITVKGSTRGTSTNSSGQFTLSAPSAATLVFSSVGYTNKEVAVSGQTTINVSLAAASQELAQVVVVGYGTQRKIDVTGSVAQVKGEDISKQSSPSPVSALQGKVAGVQITNSGAPGASPQITIRGTGTVYGSTSPLYVVDGVWFDDISFLNPADIENISILKDASSESIYGIRAANGVVLVTTRKGKNGQAVVSYNGYAGFQRVTNRLKMANGTQYATLLNEKSNYSGGDTLFSNPSKFGEGTDWYNLALRNAFTTNHQISVSGGSERSTFNFSLGYFDQQGVIKTNDFKRYTARLQNDYTISKAIKVGYTAIGTAINSTDIPSGVFNQLFSAAPIVPVKNPDGSYGDPADYSLGASVSNPQAALDFYNQKSKNYRVTGNVYADVKFARHFTYHFSIGGDFAQNEVRGYTPVYNATSIQNNQISSLTLSRAETRNWILENTITYDNKFKDHSVKILVGQSAQQYKYYKVTGPAKGVPYNSEGDLYLALGTAGTSNAVDEGDLSTITSYFSRINYSFRNRYLVTLSMRADGSSKFLGDQRWGYFPSVGLGWIISDEAFMKNQNLFNLLKLRGSWGRIGNASIPSNISTLTVAQGGAQVAFFGQPSLPYTGASINTIVPPTLYWERGEGTDIGLEAGFLHNKLSFDADFYNKKTSRAIFDVPVLGSLGTNTSTIIANQADFQNRGFELAVTWRNNINKDWSYSINGNVGINNNKVLSVVTGNNAIYGGGSGATGGQFVTRTIAGQPIGQFFGQQVTGIFQTKDEIDKDTSKSGAVIQSDAKPGDFKYADTNGDGVIDARDRVVLGNPNPKYTYGINTNWAYRQFDLTLDFQGVAKVNIYSSIQGLRYGNENYTRDFYNTRWHGQGTSNVNPSADIVGRSNYLPNSWFVQSGSYFRVRNIQLGYTLPSDIANRWRMKRLRIYANAQNAFNFFKYKGFSPEVGRVAGQNPTNTGIDTNVYPLSATYNFGVNLTL